MYKLFFSQPWKKGQLVFGMYKRKEKKDKKKLMYTLTQLPVDFSLNAGNMEEHIHPIDKFAQLVHFSGHIYNELFKQLQSLHHSCIEKYIYIRAQVYWAGQPCVNIALEEGLLITFFDWSNLSSSQAVRCQCL